MAIVSKTGNGGAVQVADSDDFTNFNTVAFIRNWSVEETADMIDVTDMSNGGVRNFKTGLKTFVDLKPHINLIDNFHYARNISLPGSIKDRYDIEFKISPPSNIELALHNDWNEEYGKNLLNEYTFNYKRVNFEQIAKTSRR